MDNLLQEFRFAVRVLLKSPGFAAVVILTLALGISANTTIFSWIDSTLLDPVPGVGGTRSFVAFVMDERNGNTTPPLSYLDYLDLQKRNRSFKGLMAYHDDWMALTGKGRPERVYGAFTSANYFEVLGVRPVLGRGFLPEEDSKPGAASVVVISYALWQTRFAGADSVLGKTIAVNQHPLTIVGVAPPAFQGCKTGIRADVWIPLTMVTSITGMDQLAARDNFWLNGFGRLNSGVSRRQAESEINLLMQQIARQFPNEHKDSTKIKLEPLWRSPIGANGVLSIFLPMLIGISGVVLLLACANVSNLFLVRLVSRRREIAIRLSMGAGRWQIVRQLMVESLLLSLIAAMAAFLITSWTAKTFDRFIPAVNAPIALSIHVDQSVFWVSLFLSVFAAMLFGLLPALRSSRMSLLDAIKEESGNGSVGLQRSRLMRALVVTQISLSAMLLVCGGLFVRSLHEAQRSDPGFNPDQVLLCSFDLLPVGYSRTNGLEFDRQLLTRLSALPGVVSATLADSVPLCMENHTSFVDPEGYVRQPHESMEIGRAYVGPRYLQTLRMPLIAGRDLEMQDTDSSQPVALINEAFAERYWPGQEPLGKRVQIEGRWATIVGVTRNAKWRSIAETPAPFIFVPLSQDYYPQVTIHVRVDDSAPAFIGVVTKTVHELSPDLPLFDITTLQSRIQASTFVFRCLSTMVGSFGIVALVLAAIGIYGVVAYTTRLRTREVGIRMALGAQRSEVFRLILRQGLGLTLSGLVIGLASSLALTQVVRSQLYGVATTDMVTYSVVSILLWAVAFVACILPARQAMNLEPVKALRHD